MTEKLRKPQQAAVGTKTRSAGRTPSHPALRRRVVEGVAEMK